MIDLFSANQMHYPTTMMEISDDIISEMEKFTRTHLASRLERKDEHERINHFGQFFASNPKDFQFVAGEKILLKQLASQVKAIVEKKGIDYFDKSSNTQLKVGSADAQRSGTHMFLEKLLQQANRNYLRKKQGYRYDVEVKQIATYIRMLSGPLCYETLQANLQHALPSLGSTNRYIRKSHFKVNEGVLRSMELVEYLKERNLPMVVALSEDATRIVERIQYDRSTNQVIGFTLPLKDGIPIPFSYPARSFSEITKHFTSENSSSSLMNVVMAQPLANAKPFCLYIFGSDNKYNACDVFTRWATIARRLKEVGVSVLTVSSDSDPRYNSAMRCGSNLGVPSTLYTAEFLSTGDILNSVSPIGIQDTIHIGTKLRNFLLKTFWDAKMLPFGLHFINIGHLYELIRRFPKDQHELTNTVLNPHDKQNFASVNKMCSEKVISMLQNQIENSQGTTVFLKMMRFVIDSFLDMKLKPLERVEKLWYSVFLIRLWRQSILSGHGTTLKKNFLTANCFACIELNAHGLINILLRLRKSNCPYLFLPHLFSSQPCESLFRQVRSMTTTHSTVVNFSVKEMLDKINRIQLQSNITSDLSAAFVFPRSSKHNKNHPVFKLPSTFEIYMTMEASKKQACTDAIELGLIDSSIFQPQIPCSIRPIFVEPKPKDKKTMNQCKMLDLVKFKRIVLKNYVTKFQNVVVDETSPYVEIPKVSKQRIVLKKTSLCWLLRGDYSKLSSDRLERVKDSGNRRKTKLTSKNRKYFSYKKKPKSICNRK